MHSKAKKRATEGYVVRVLDLVNPAKAHKQNKRPFGDEAGRVCGDLGLQEGERLLGALSEEANRQETC